MELILQIGVLAFLVEAIVETLKMIYKENKLDKNIIVALTIGVLIALTVGVDIFKVLDIPTKIPYVGELLTGILISRGGNFIHDLFSKLKE